MKFMHITFHFEYSEAIEEILDKYQIRDFVRYPRVESKDSDGKHFGNQVFPGHSAVIQAQVPEEKVEQLFTDLKQFKEDRKSHQHLEAVVLPIESRLE